VIPAATRRSCLEVSLESPSGFGISVLEVLHACLDIRKEHLIAARFFHLTFEANTALAIEKHPQGFIHTRIQGAISSLAHQPLHLAQDVCIHVSIENLPVESVPLAAS
jgi:hypothetical protein